MSQPVLKHMLRVAAILGIQAAVAFGLRNAMVCVASCLVSLLAIQVSGAACHIAIERERVGK